MKRSLEMPVTDGRTDGHMDRPTDGTEFTGPLSALPGIQKPEDKIHEIRTMKFFSSKSFYVCNYCYRI